MADSSTAGSSHNVLVHMDLAMQEVFVWFGLADLPEQLAVGPVVVVLLEVVAGSCSKDQLQQEFQGGGQLVEDMRIEKFEGRSLGGMLEQLVDMHGLGKLVADRTWHLCQHEIESRLNFSKWAFRNKDTAPQMFRLSSRSEIVVVSRLSTEIYHP